MNADCGAAQAPPVGGRVFFSNVGRSLEFEDQIVLVSVGVDIGSSTSHLVFSRLRLERLDSRYVVAERQVMHESDVLLTPYAADDTIDADMILIGQARSLQLSDSIIATTNVRHLARFFPADIWSASSPA